MRTLTTFQIRLGLLLLSIALFCHGARAGATAQALNLSTRLRVETGESVLIGGFIVTGNTSKAIVLRAKGPSLAGTVPFVPALADPILELRGPDGSLIMRNDNWKDDQRAQVEGTIYEPTDDLESVIVVTLQPGAYTVAVTGHPPTPTGLALVEVYDTDPSSDSQLANISSRGLVRIGDSVMIGGFILGGSTTGTNVAVRGVGASLINSGVLNALADPTLELHDSNGAILVSNDNWLDDPISAAQLTANGLALSNVNEAGIFTSQPPGAYTAILAGKNGNTGVGLLEIYNVH